MTAAPVREPKPVGFVDGVTALFGGLGFVIGRPSVWGWALVPILVATVLFGGLSTLAVLGSEPLAARIVDGTELPTVQLLLRVVIAALLVVLAVLVAFSLAQPISGFALEAIARRQEIALGGPKRPDQPFVAGTLRSLRVTLTALVVSLPIFAVLAIVALLFPPASVVTVPLKFLLTGLTVAYDFLDYPLSLRGTGVRSRLGFIRDHFTAVLGFGAAATLLLLVPGLGLMLLPAGVAGAARLVVLADRGAKRA